MRKILGIFVSFKKFRVGIKILVFRVCNGLESRFRVAFLSECQISGTCFVILCKFPFVTFLSNRINYWIYVKLNSDNLGYDLFIFLILKGRLNMQMLDNF